MSLLLALLLAAQPGGYDRSERSDLLDFHYAWPAEAEAIPALRADLRRRMAIAYADALASARQSRDSAHDGQVPFYREQYDEVWSLEASSRRYFSFTASNRTDQNGAHPNRDFDALLWDRARGEARSAASLLGPVVLARLQPIFCEHLRSEIAVRGGEPPRRCPLLRERVLSFLDQDHNGSFETLHVLVAPYVAASYADGAFVVDVLFNRGDLSGMAAADREGLEETPGR